jgi:hypothetical protein
MLSIKLQPLHQKHKEIKMQTKKIADEICKSGIGTDVGRPKKQLLTLQLDRNTVRNLEKVLSGAKGFANLDEDKIQLQLHIELDSDVDLFEFEIHLNQLLKTKQLTNVRFDVVKTIGRPALIGPRI